MSDQNKTTRKLEEAPKPGAASPVKPSGMKRFFSKRWVFPAVYMAAAAIIVTILWLNADAGGKKEDQAVTAPGTVETPAGQEGASSPESVPAAASGETLRLPFKDSEDMGVLMNYWNANGSAEEKEAAMVEWNNSFTAHMGVDYANKTDNTKSFEVLAALSGKVMVADMNPVNGYEVEIQSPDGYVTVYQSLEDLKVQVGDEVKQGDVIAMAGRSEVEKDEGVHVHFEVRNNGQPVDPNTLIQAE
ncbi:M23 family metallopeptidase [Cohnella lubricantis]|uniref:M23 family metallopeptidase n=1 Tax=Cohnella lubricantis TaxID=2163172 RepID=A0A841TI42_9BACL|nr:M23 family metallopeptidase [Cohnella lubricantis]MBB6679559.1 M23 family metallopeptidase [Cohnella lubricantis]MBP2117833.1 stage II sporulation protein Q [Cohnella lubricantis]